MSNEFKDVESLVCESKINIPYHWWAGDTASRFLISLRDKNKIIATKCNHCSKTYLPPRKICPLCFSEKMEWHTLSNEGFLQAFTIVRRQLASLNRVVPVIYGLIKLDGADTAMLHYVDEILFDDLKIGMRVSAKFRDHKSGSIQDILYFKPA